MSRYIVTRYIAIENTQHNYRPEGRINTTKILNSYKEARRIGLNLDLLISIRDDKTDKVYYYNKDYKEISHEEFLQLLNQLKLKHHMGV